MLHTTGQTLGTYYQIEALIGHGGMATVYRARHSVLGSSHAVKLLLPHLAARRDIRLRFLEEGKIQARLRHPHIVPVTDLIRDEGTAGLVMAWMSGRDLRQHLDKNGPLHLTEAIRLALQALDALALVHEHGVIHRDIKPANLFLEDARRGPPLLRVMDFGIAKIIDKSQTRTTGLMGSCAYMSPEQIASPKHIDPRSDLFSMATVLAELLTGQPAFAADTDFETMRRITSGQLPLLPGPPPLRAALVRALQKDPAARFPDADTFAAALLATVDQAPVPLHTPEPEPEPEPEPMPTPAPVSVSARGVDLFLEQRDLERTRLREKVVLVVGGVMFMVGLFASVLSAI